METCMCKCVHAYVQTQAYIFILETSWHHYAAKHITVKRFWGNRCSSWNHLDDFFKDAKWHFWVIWNHNHVIWVPPWRKSLPFWVDLNATGRGRGFLTLRLHFEVELMSFCTIKVSGIILAWRSLLQLLKNKKHRKTFENVKFEICRHAATKIFSSTCPQTPAPQEYSRINNVMSKLGWRAPIENLPN